MNSMYGVLAAFNTASHHDGAFGRDEEKRIERNTVRTIEGGWDEFDTNVLRMAGAKLLVA
jgi:hypothetical protein